MVPRMPLVHETFFAWVDDLDRIFDRENMFVAVLIDVINESRERR